MVGRLSVVAMPRWLIAGTVFASGVAGACRLDVMVDCGHRDESKRVVADPANGGWGHQVRLAMQVVSLTAGPVGVELWLDGYGFEDVPVLVELGWLGMST